MPHQYATSHAQFARGNGSTAELLGGESRPGAGGLKSGGAPYTESIMPRQATGSREMQRRAESLFPGGVNSPVRAFRAVGGAPPFVVRGEGAYLWDADGNRYIDYFGSWGPMVLGHAFPPVVRAVQEAAARGTSYGASTPSEADLAELVIAAFPSIE